MENSEEQCDSTEVYLKLNVMPILEPLQFEILEKRPLKRNAFIYKWLKDQHSRDSTFQMRQTSGYLNNEQIIQPDDVFSYRVKEKLKKRKCFRLGVSGESQGETIQLAEEQLHIKGLPVSPCSSAKQILASKTETDILREKSSNLSPVELKDKETVIRILVTLRNSPLFKTLEERTIEKIIIAMRKKTFEPGQHVIQVGQQLSEVIIPTEEGFEWLKNQQKEKKSQEQYMQSQIEKLSVYSSSFSESKESKANTNIQKFKVWDTFGELSLLYNVQAQECLLFNGQVSGGLWTLQRQKYRRILWQAADEKIKLCFSIFEKAKIFATLTSQQKLKLCEAMVLKKYMQGSYIIQENQIGDCFYLVSAGKLVAEKLDKKTGDCKPVYYYGEGDYFGEISLVKNVPRQASIKALTNCTVLQINRSTFKRLVGSLQSLLRRDDGHYSEMRKALRRVSLEGKILSNIDQCH